MSCEVKTNMAYFKNSRHSQDETILITGGGGFIGTNLTKYLADKTYQLRILDNLSTGKEENLEKSIKYGDYGDNVTSPPIQYSDYIAVDINKERKKIRKARNKNINKLLK